MANSVVADTDRLMLALARIEEAEESLREAHDLIRELFAQTLPGGGDA